MFIYKGAKLSFLSLVMVLASCSGGGGGTSSPPPSGPSNQAPTADAGTDTTTSLQAAGINLDGSVSNDPDGDSLNFSWTIVSQPTGASATIANEGTAQPTLQTMVPGEYVIELVVNDGNGGTSSDTITLNLQNDAPVISIDAVSRNLAIGEPVTLNPTGSSDPNGHSLTYKWTLLSAPSDSNLVSSFDGATPIVSFDAEGSFEVSVEVSDGYTAAVETLSFDITQFVRNDIASAFTYLETDASANLIAIAEESSLEIIDTDGSSVQSFSLPRTITSLAVSPNGEWIGAAHLDSVSIIRVSDGSTFGPWDVSIQPGDVIIGNDGVAHTFPRTGQWVRALSISPETGVETNSTGRSIRHGTIVRSHPDGNKAYGANNGLSPSDIERYDLSDGKLDLAYDSPYHGDFPFSGNLWISENGELILAASGVVVRSTDTQSTDMTFIMQLENQGQIVDATYEASQNQWYLVERSGNVASLNIYDGSSGAFVSSLDLPELTSGSGDSGSPTHVVSDLASKTVSIFAADHPTNPQSFAVFKKGFVDRELLDFPPVAHITNSAAGFVGDTIRLDASASFDPEGEDLQFSWTLDDEPDISSIILSPTDTPSVQFDPQVAGNYTLTLTVSDGERTAMPETVVVRVVEPGNGLQLRLLGSPSDIVYNKIRNEVLYTSSDSKELRIRSLESSSEQVITLPRIGERIDVSPDGNYAAISHSGLSSLIDLRGAQAELIDTQEYSEDWGGHCY